MKRFLILSLLTTSCAGLKTSMDKSSESSTLKKDDVAQKHVAPHGTSQHQDIFFAAKKKVEAERYSEAKPILEEYIRKAPTGMHVDQAQLFLGQLALREKQYPQAETYF